jgi:hypothetical protein
MKPSLRSVYSRYGLFIPLYTGSDFRWALLERSSSRERPGIHRCQLIREMSGTVLPLAGAHAVMATGKLREISWCRYLSWATVYRLSVLRNVATGEYM